MKENPNPHAKPRSGVEQIDAERNRQDVIEGYDFCHDDEHINGELRTAAECYLLELRSRKHRGQLVKSPPPAWPWEKQWWKPTDDEIRQLVKARALIAAEIDRLQRLRVVKG